MVSKDLVKGVEKKRWKEDSRSQHCKDKVELFENGKQRPGKESGEKDIKGRIQGTTLFRSLKILWKFLETWGDLLGLRLQWNTTSLRWCEKHAKVKLLSTEFCVPTSKWRMAKSRTIIMILTELKRQVVEHEDDGDTNYNWRTRYSHQKIGTGTGGLGNKRTRGNYLNYSLV